MTQRNIPVRRHAVEEAHQRTGALGEFKAVQQLVLCQAALATDQVADVRLGQLVVGQVQRLEFMLFELLRHRPGFMPVGNLDADEHVRGFFIADAVVKFRHVARADERAEALEAAPLFAHGDGKHGFAELAQLGTLGNEAQAVEIHVGAAGDGDQRLVDDGVLAQAGPLHVGLGARDGQRAGRFQDGARIRKHILDGGADGVRVDDDDVIDILLRQAEGFLAHQAHRRAVRKQAHVGQGHPFARFQRARHGVRIDRLHADDLDVGANLFHVRRHAGDQAAAADGDEDGVDGAGMLAQDFHADRALAGDHVRIVERVHEGQLLFFFQGQRVVVGVRVGLAVQHDFHMHAAARLDGVDLDGGRGGGHDDDGAATHARGRQGHALGMVACRSANDAALAFRIAELGHLVVGAANLEAEHALHVFALEVNLVVQALRQGRGQFQRRFGGDVIDAGGQDFLEVVDVHSLQASDSGPERVWSVSGDSGGAAADSLATNNALWNCGRVCLCRLARCVRRPGCSSL